MRKLFWMVGLVVVAVACGTAGDMVGEMLDSGVPDAGAQPGDCPCEVGPQGEQGVPGVGSVVWKDADGATVARMVGMKYDRYYFDLDGNVWAVTSADDLTVTETSAGGTWLAYSSRDCTGTAYILSGTVPPQFPLPRMTFTIPSDPNTIRVRPDGSALQVIEWCSSMTDGGCVGINEGACNADYVAINADDTVPETPLTIPTLSHTRPSHPELP